jgi:glycosyltransferase involved in cell wall biosynthesis
MNTRPLLALCVPCYNEQELLPETISKLTAVLDELKSKNRISSDSFMLFIDDGSTDNTWQVIETSSTSNSFLKGIKLSKNLGHQIALMAGMEYLVDKCDCLISLDADLQQDESAINDFMAKYSTGSEVVLGIRNDRVTDSYLKKMTALGFYRFLSIMGVKIVKNHADYRLLSNRANKSLMEFTEVNLFLRGMIHLIGFKTDYVYFQVRDRKLGESKYTFSKMINFALDGITSFSVMPLRIITFFGFIIFLATLGMSAFILLAVLFTNRAIPGWASIVLPIYFIGGIQLLALGVLGEYVGRIFKETKRRPRYFIESETQ